MVCSDYSPSYDLLGEEDPDDFVNVDIPEDLSASDTAIMPPTGGKERPNIHVQCMNIHIAMMGLHVCNMLRGKERTLPFLYKNRHRVS